MQKAVSILFIVSLMGCGNNGNLTGPQGPQGPAGPTGPVVTVSPTPSPESAVQSMVDNENAYRESVGQELLLPGLACSLYSVSTSTSCLVQTNPASCVVWSSNTYTSVGSFLFTGVFNQPNTSVNNGLNVLPAGLVDVVQQWYVLNCTGDFVVSDDSWHDFSVTSDDGSLLYIDGLLINNDGLHGAQTKSASKYLKYGIHSFQLEYLQASGNEALVLTEDGSVMQSTATEAFYH